MILYIEDSVVSQRVFARMFHDILPVRVASTGVAGLSLAAQQPWDAIIVDHLLPDHTSLTLVPALRSLPALSLTPIVVLSASMDDYLASSLLRMGANVCTLKPVALAFRTDLVQLIQHPHCQLPKWHATECISWIEAGTQHVLVPSTGQHLIGLELETLLEQINKGTPTTDKIKTHTRYHPTL